MIDPKSAAFFNDKLVEITNPLGEELSIMRPSMIPSMLKAIANNIRFGNNELKLFEVAKIFTSNNNVGRFIPNISEQEHICIGLYGNYAPKQRGIAQRGVDFYDVKGIVAELLDFLKIQSYEFKMPENNSNVYSANFMEIYLRGEKIGEFGEANPNILKLYDIEQTAFIADIYAYKLYEFGFEQPHYEQISQYPPALRDLAFVFDESVPAGDVLVEIQNQAGSLLQRINLFDVYKGKTIEDGKKSLAFSLNFSSPERTLTDQEINEITDKIILQIEKKFNAQLRKF
jgi:phenylalanyl-tRNA synthetase beta chain